MNRDLAQKIVDHYTSCLEKHRGDLGKEVDWRDAEQARIRNDFICDYLAKQYQSEMDHEAEITDYGCGTGSLFNHFRSRGFDDEQYQGFDASPEMVLEAKKRYGEDRFFHVPVGEPIITFNDFTIVSGVFTEKGDASKYEWLYEVVAPTLKMLLNVTEVALMVNFMNSHSLPLKDQREELFFLDSNEMVNLAAELGVKKYTIKAGSLPFEHWIVLEK